MDSHGNRSDFGRHGADSTADSADRVLSGQVLEVVTRQLSERLTKTGEAVRGTLPAVPETEIARFCDLLVHEETSLALDYFGKLRAHGVTLDALCLSYVAPAAQMLGERWCEDECGFLEVTLGTSRLHGLLRSLRPDFAFAAKPRLEPPTALFAAIPGETHLLGVTMAADFFRRAGWSIDLISAPDADALCERAEAGDYDVIGLTAGCEAVAPDLEHLVGRLRSVAPGSKLVLGGHLGELDPDGVESLELDAILTDITNAPFICQSLLKVQSEH